MSLQEKIEREDLALYEVLRHPAWSIEYIKNCDPHIKKEFELHDYQVEFLCDFNSEISMASARSIGKSLAIEGKIYWALINKPYNPTDYIVYLVPVERQLELVWSELSRECRTNPILKGFIKSINGSKNNITTWDENFLDCRIAGSLGSGQNVKSIHTPLLIVDEAQGIPWGDWVEMNQVINRETEGYQKIVSGVTIGVREKNVLFHVDMENDMYSKHRITSYRSPRFTEKDLEDALATYGGEESTDFIRNVCFTPDTKIYTDRGLVSISEVSVGDTVLTHKGTWKKVVKTYKTPYEGKLLDIRTEKSNETLKCTPNHPIYAYSSKVVTWSGNKPYALWKGYYWSGKKTRINAKQFNPEFIDAKDLKRLDKVAFPKFKFTKELPEFIDLESWSDYADEGFVYKLSGTRSKDVKSKRSKTKRFIPINSETLFILGLYVAEGSSYRNQISFSVSAEETKLIERIRNFASLMGSNSHVKVNKGTKSAIVGFNSFALANFLRESFGHLAPNKKIPKMFMGIKGKDILPFVEGMFAGDGSIRVRSRGAVINKPYASYTTVSKNLSDDLAYILTGWGINPTSFISKGKIVSFKTYQSMAKDAYTLEINPQQIATLYANNTYTFDTFSTGEQALMIKNISEIEYKGYVYNLGVEDDNSYVTKNCAVHNCGRHSSPAFVVFSRMNFKIVEIPVSKSIIRNQMLVGDTYAEKLAYVSDLLQSLPRAKDGVDYFIGVDVGYSPDPTAIFIGYFDDQGKFHFQCRIALHKLNYTALQAPIIDLLDSKYHPYKIGIDAVGVGITVVQELQSNTKYAHKDYENRVFSVMFNARMVVGFDEDGEEVKRKVRPYLIELLQEWSNDHRILYSSTDTEIISELERMEYSRTTNGEKVYRTRTERGGKRGKDHFTSALLCIVAARYSDEEVYTKRNKNKRPSMPAMMVRIK